MRVFETFLVFNGILSAFAFQISEADCHTSLWATQLANHVMSTLTIGDIDSCYRTCAAKSGCQSINYYKEKSLCELNSRTIEDAPHMTVANEDSVYFTIPVPKNCAGLYESGFKESGVFSIDADGKGSFKVYCDQKTTGGGWTVFQRRMDGSVDFYRGWNDYKKGFGDLEGEFWLGLDKIYRLTNKTRYRLRVELEDWEGNGAYAEYDYFAVDSECDNYTLSLGSYSGNAGDSLSYHRGMPFSTKDRDNDKWNSNNCAVEHKGGWWFNACHHSNLNGLYHHVKATPFPPYGVVWHGWKSYFYSAKRAEMKIRPV